MVKWGILALLEVFQGPIHAAEGIVKTTLLNAESAWEGAAYRQYLAGAPQITMLKVTVEQNKVLAWHIHPCISADYMSGGSVSLTVRKTGERRTFRQEDSFTDTVNIVHQY